LKNKFGGAAGAGGEQKGELLDQFDDYLEKLKKKHMQELNELTKRYKLGMVFSDLKFFVVIWNRKRG